MMSAVTDDGLSCEIADAGAGRFLLKTGDTPEGAQLRAFASQTLPFLYVSKDGSLMRFVGTQSSMLRLDRKIRQCNLRGRYSAAAIDLVSRAEDFQRRKANAYSASVGLQIPGLVTQPWAHQLAGSYTAMGGASVYLSMRPGTGKSLTTIGALCAAQHRRVLVLCPRSVIRVWPRELNYHAPGVYAVHSLEKGSVKDKVEQANQLYVNLRGPLMLVVNYDSFRVADFAKWAQSKRWDAVVCDESHRIKSPFGITAKSVHKLYACSGQRFCLSGTPMPHDPLDIWSQCAFLDPGLFGTSFVRFRSRYAKLGFFRNVESFVNLDELSELFAMISFHVGEEVLSLPPVTHVMRSFSLRPATMKAYEKLRTELAAEFQGETVIAANTLVKAVRLQQISSGFLVNEDGTVVDLEDRGKIDLFAEILEDQPKGEPLVVCTRFHHDLDAVRQVTEARGLKYGELSGRRNDLGEDAKMPEGFDVFAVNIASGGVGIDLTRSCHAVVFSLSWSAGDYDQFLHRLKRPGQEKHVTFTHLVAERTIDDAIYGSMRHKQGLSDAAMREAVVNSIRSGSNG